jgi:YidC/Oxa1 family membrane protein insertase
MEKKNTILGVLFLALALGLLVWSDLDQKKRLEEWQKEHPEAAAAANTTAPGANTTAETPGNTTTATANAAFPTLNPPAASAGEAAPATPAATYSLSNDDIKVTFTEDGGAIQTVVLKKFVKELHGTDPVVFNENAPLPALILSLASAEGEGVPPVSLHGPFALVASARTLTTIAFDYRSPEGVEMARSYAIRGTQETGDAYLIESNTSILNRGERPISLARLFINAGMEPPTPSAGTIASRYLDFGYYNGEKAYFISWQRFADRAAMLFGLIPERPKLPYLYAQEDTPDLEWVSVKNQFFAAVLTPQNVVGSGYFAQGVPMTVEGKQGTGVTGDLEVNLGVLGPQQEKSFVAAYYVGPKEYLRLDRLGQRQDLVMEFGWFGGLSKILLFILFSLHTQIVRIAPAWSWGWAIVVITIFIKVLTWPMTQIQVKSAKRMGKIQQPLAELREKYKDNPQKLQSEMMELFKKNKINPAAGCLPMLIQIPVLFSFYGMLRTAAELRFASFLWIHDLSAPDTIAHVGSLPINLLPLLMACSMAIQMRMTPTPTTDNTQRQIFQFMPLMILFTCYNLPAGMSLYWTCQNVLTIFQQLLTNRKKDDPAADPGRPAPGKGSSRPSWAAPRPTPKRK